MLSIRLAPAVVLFGILACTETPPPEKNPVPPPLLAPTKKPSKPPDHGVDLSRQTLMALKMREKCRQRIKNNPLELLESSGSSNELTTTITGRIRNNTSRNYTYVQALFNVFDANGNRVGSALANINNLGPKEIWKFKAVYFGSDGKRFSLSKIEGY